MYSNDIRTALAAIHEVRRDAGAPGRNFADAAIKLLTAQGYESERTLEDETGSAAEFIQDENGQVPDTESGRLFITEAESARTLFQYTEEEIQERAQSSLFDASEYDKAVSDSFFFIAVELKGQTYPRGRYASFVREVNKQFPGAPAVVLFHTSTGLLSLAFVHHRQNKRDPDRDVLGRVSLIREIDPDKPHRAHLDILDTLSLRSRLDWIGSRGRAPNFDGLLDAWLDALDTEELNRRFYRDLFAWFERAVEKATFPRKQRKTLKPEEHVIRLITRLMFVWFVKEKGLVADDLFIENRVSQMLRDYDADNGGSYYRAVLQNLFFATLNTEIDKRGFSNRTNDHHRDFSRYRYKSEMADPDGLLALFKQTPFINGGLFDCLDSEESTADGGYRIDCFSDVKSQRHGYSIPNALFFSEDGKAPGLITLFNRYKFTVEENTPAEQEVALDPELLGKVFENLLAAYNPETRETARRQTGSYYTPREVVDYMVDEALVAALAQKTQPANGDAQGWRETLRRLLDYLDDDGKNEWGGLPDAQRESLVGAIAELKTLDPAVGSGAFPMAVLHKLTLALRRLDPHNELWSGFQKELAGSRSAATFDRVEGLQQRGAALAEINETFELYRDSDYGRKLYLIQNGIYGVDVQAVATQIAKLRFFISLAIEQQPTEDRDNNYGIRPLPNLETRFVAANTLFALAGATQGFLPTNDVRRLRQELRENRERHFHANTRQQKIACRREDARLRQRLAAALRKADFPVDEAEKVAAWDPYDQNMSADWFDPLYMFGVDGGFDVVIGNPPYINVENLDATTKAHLFSHYETCEKRTDIYIAFLERALSLNNAGGVFFFILPASFTKQKYATKMRRKLIEDHSILQLVDASSYRIFEKAVVFNVVLGVANHRNDESTTIRIHESNADFVNRTGTEFSVDQKFFTGLKDSRLDTNPNLASAVNIKDKAWQNAVRFDEICFVAYGARLNSSSRKVGKAHYISTSHVPGAKRFCEGGNIERYFFSQGGWLKYTPDEHYNSPMFPELFENNKLMFIRIVKDRLRFAYDDAGFYNSHTVINCVRLDLLRNSSHRSAVRAVKRGDIGLAAQFDYKYLLAVLNSAFISWYFRSLLSDNLNFLPQRRKRTANPQNLGSQTGAHRGAGGRDTGGEGCGPGRRHERPGAADRRPGVRPVRADGGVARGGGGGQGAGLTFSRGSVDLLYARRNLNSRGARLCTSCGSPPDNR